MARARSFIKLNGSMGETTFKQLGNKTFANDKVVVSKERVKYHSDYNFLRKNGKHLINASKSAKAVRDALSNLIDSCKDSKMAGRFTSEMMKVLKRDSSYDAFGRGMEARAENMGLLLGFNFNHKASLRAIFNVAFTTEINRQAGEVKINIASFKPASAVKAPPLARQFKIMAQVADIDFDPAVEFNKKFTRIGMYSSESIELNQTPTEPLAITVKVNTGNVNTIFIALGVDFRDSTNMLYASLDQSKRVNPGCIVAVDEGVTVPAKGIVGGKV